MTFSISRSRRFAPALTPRALASAISLCFIASAPAFAQSAIQMLAPVVITATRTPQLASEVLSDNTSIDAEEIARSGAGSLIDLLQKQRGIEVTRNGGAGTSSSVFIRGASNSQSIILIDGVRTGSSSLGGAAWSAIPLSVIDHVEIVYGPLSTLYGADAIGGVIQIFTKKGIASAPQVSAFAGVGSDATRQYDASVAGATGGEHSFSYALSAGKEKSDGFSAIKPGSSYYNPDKDGYDKESASGQFGLQLAKGHEIGLLFFQSRLDAQRDNGPGYNARALQKLENVAVFAKNTFLPNWSSQLQVAQSRDKSSDDGGTEAWDKFQINATQTNIAWQNDIRIGADVLQILFDHSKEEVLSSSTPELAHDRTTKAVATSYNLKRDKHLASISLRNDDNSQYGSKTTGAFGYGYRVTSALRANASFGTSFRAPTIYELYYPNYGVPTNKPEKGRNTEAGLYFDDGTSQLSAVYYHNRLTDLLVSADPCPVDPATYVYGCSYNVDKALLEGVSLSARRRFGDFNVSGNLDLQDPRDEKTGNTLARRSKKHGNFAVEYGTGALKAGVDLQFSGKRFDDAANTKAMGGYGLLNLFTTYQVAPDWSALVRWSNVADKQYELAKNFATAGSKVFVGLRYGVK